MTNTILFDLDGTLLDTAPDLAGAVNFLRRERGLNDLPLAVLRPYAGYGSKALIKAGFDINEDHPEFDLLIDAFLEQYQRRTLHETTFFPGVEALLTTLDEKNIPWGIVTNKPKRFTQEIVSRLGLDKRAQCIISGDTLSRRKPHPDPILHACQLMNVAPENAFYIGDTHIDVLASQAAGTKTLVVMYGYTHEGENPHHWKADGYLHSPCELMNWL